MSASPILPDNWRSWPVDAKYKFLAKLNQVAASQEKPVVSVLPEAQALESQGWRIWYAAMFGQSFVDALDSSETDDKHHSAAIEWHWNTRRALIRIEVETRNVRSQITAGIISRVDGEARIIEIASQRPEHDSFFTIFARGNLKTTILRRVAVADACLSVSAGVGGYALIIGGTKSKIRGTANSVNALLTKPLSARGSEVWKYYPQLAEVRRNKFGRSQGWTTDLFLTNADYVFHFAGLEQGMAGANEEDLRPTFILPDDIDDRKDSPLESETKFQVFTREVLPMGQANTLVWWAQNLISRYSTMYRVWKQQARVLTNRVMTEPIPAVRNLVTVVRTVGGIVKDVYVSGQATWRVWAQPGRIQQEIDRSGLPAFLLECQHEVEQSREGLVLQNWDDSVHVISVSQFAAMFGTRDLPRYWSKYVFNDWARTKTKYHANVAGIVTVSPQNSRLPGCVFVFNPMSFPAGSMPEDVALRLLKVISPVAQKPATSPFEGPQVRTWEEVIKGALDRGNLERFVSDTSRLIEQRRVLLSDVIPQYVMPVIRSQNYQQFRCSHERTDVQKVYRTVFGLPFQGVNPGADGGTDTLNLLQRVDYSLDHPIIQGKKGYTRFFLVAPDDETRPCLTIDLRPVTYADGRIVYEPQPYRDALAPDELVDWDLFRYQMKNWRLRDPYLTARGETEGEILKMNDDFGNGCFAAGTLVHTQTGERVIEDIQTGEMVWTRHGPRRVIASGYTGHKHIYEIMLSNGRTLQGTVDHPVWTLRRGWTDLCCLRPGDKVLSWVESKYSDSETRLRDPENERRLNTTVSGFTGIRKAALRRIGSIFSRIFMRDFEASKHYILRYGNLLTARCRKVWRFITQMATMAIMIPITSSPSPAASTPLFMQAFDLDHLNAWRILPRFSRLAGHGTQLQRDVNGTASTLRRLCGFLSRRTASFATTNTKPNLNAVGSVLSSAHTEKDLTSSDSVSVVMAPIPSGVKATYNLQVEGCPEYFANGVLVHNCMMLFYDGCVQAVPLTGDEKFEAAIPPAYTHEAIQARSDMTSDQKFFTEQYVRRQVKKELKPRVVAVDDYGDTI